MNNFYKYFADKILEKEWEDGQFEWFLGLTFLVLIVPFIIILINVKCVKNPTSSTVGQQLLLKPKSASSSREPSIFHASQLISKAQKRNRIIAHEKPFVTELKLTANTDDISASKAEEEEESEESLEPIQVPIVRRSKRLALKKKQRY